MSGERQTERRAEESRKSHMFNLKATGAQVVATAWSGNSGSYRTGASDVGKWNLSIQMRGDRVLTLAKQTTRRGSMSNTETVTIEAILACHNMCVSLAAGGTTLATPTCRKISTPCLAGSGTTCANVSGNDGTTERGGAMPCEGWDVQNHTSISLQSSKKHQALQNCWPESVSTKTAYLSAITFLDHEYYYRLRNEGSRHRQNRRFTQSPPRTRSGDETSVLKSIWKYRRPILAHLELEYCQKVL